ncbi:GPW/gp25 family protein [Burkholderia guangdongensis]|uniref:GPW/gp25 family protein n=1 Tax=Burkholderia guangdongensis TaxID=1792500 RepID=UPI0015CE4556|nr:GPW/gp25 family protein [Burkholderia guangdongensis]
MNSHPLYSKLSTGCRNDSFGEVVCRHVADLMNCALRGARIDAPADSPAAYSVLNYGSPPLQVSGAFRVDPMRTAAHICEVIRRFEPRVDGSRTVVQPRLGDRPMRQMLYFDIRTTVRDGGAELRVSLAFDYLNGFFSPADG